MPDLKSYGAFITFDFIIDTRSFSELLDYTTKKLKMDVKITHKALNWLLEKYFEDPNALWDISESLRDEEGTDAELVHELGIYLVKKGYVRNPQFLVEGFSCTITVLGINQVSNIFTHVKYQVLAASIEEKKRSLMDILGIEPGHFKKVQDYATYLKRLGIIECIFHSNDVYAEPTFYGREWYNENKLKFIH